MGSAVPQQGVMMAQSAGMPAYSQGAMYPPQQGSIYPQQQPMMPPLMAPTAQSMPIQAQQYLPPGGPGPMPLPAGMAPIQRYPSPLPPPTSGMMTSVPMTQGVQHMVAQPMMAAGAAPGFVQPAYTAYPSSAPVYQNPPTSIVVESGGHHPHGRLHHHHHHSSHYPGAGNGTGYGF